MQKLNNNQKQQLHGGFLPALMTGIMAAQMIIGPLIRGAVTVSNIVNDVKSQPDPEGYMVGISDNGPAPVRSSFSSAKARHSFLSPYASSLYSGF